jgi:hypothetical protein
MSPTSYQTALPRGDLRTLQHGLPSRQHRQDGRSGSAPMLRYLRYVRFPLICCAVGVTAVFVSHGGFTAAGVQAAWITLVLLALEISLSFDNAVVNARVLETMTACVSSAPCCW